MSHRRRRISRVLLGVLAVTIAAGLFTYARRPSPTKANGVAVQPAASTAASQPRVIAADPPQTQPTLAMVPAGIDRAVIEPAKQSQQPQQPPTPLRTETPGALVTKTLAGQAPAPRAMASSAGSSDRSVAPASPAPDSGKVTIKPYQPSASTTSTSPRPTTAGGAEAIADGRAKLQAGKHLEARDTVNAALVSGHLRGADADAARALLSEVNQTVVFSNRKFADDRFGGTYQVLSGDRLDRIGAKFGVTSDMLMKVNAMSDARRLRSGAYIKVLKGPFHAVVSKSAFRLDLYLGGLPNSGADVCYVTSYPVGLGKENSTPLGKWLVEPDRKVKNPVYYSPRGEGVIEADDPKNPLGEFWIGLVGLDGEAVGKESYGIHGTIDPDSIGKMASMGCIRLRNEDVAVVFSALVEGKSTVLVTE